MEICCFKSYHLYYFNKKHFNIESEQRQGFYIKHSPKRRKLSAQLDMTRTAYGRLRAWCTTYAIDAKMESSDALKFYIPHPSAPEVVSKKLGTFQTPTACFPHQQARSYEFRVGRGILYIYIYVAYLTSVCVFPCVCVAGICIILWLRVLPMQRVRIELGDGHNSLCRSAFSSHHIEMRAGENWEQFSKRPYTSSHMAKVPLFGWASVSCFWPHIYTYICQWRRYGRGESCLWLWPPKIAIIS